jgi:carboxypeptidase family protein
LFLASPLNLSAVANQGRISGTIFDPQGVAVSRAHLKLMNSAGSLVRETTSDPQGNFTLDGVDAGEYQLRGESDAFVPVTVEVSLAAGQQKEINLQFQ